MTGSLVDEDTRIASSNTSPRPILRSSTSTIRGRRNLGDDSPSTIRNYTSLDSSCSDEQTALDHGIKAKSRIPLAHFIALSKGWSDGIGTPDLASDGGSEITGSLEANPPTLRDGAKGSRETIGDDTYSEARC
jgi:hypothetical protein